MTPEMGTSLSIGLAFIIAAIMLIISAQTGQMVLIEHLKEDWIYRLPFQLKNNRYRGLSRSCYQLLATLFYIAKAIVILALCGYYYILAGILILIKWVWTTIANHINYKQSNDPASQMQSSQDTNQTIFTAQTAAIDENAISILWNHGSEIAWHTALDHYYELLTDEERVLDHYMENIDTDKISKLSALEFYTFLHDRYFVWKYTAKNRLATTRKSLRRYIDENRLSDLANIHQRLFSADLTNIEECLYVATEIQGLGPAGASGLLSILFPQNFGTIDQYVVKALKEIDRLPYKAELAKMNPDSLSMKNGVLLIRILREQAVRLNQQFNTDFWTPRKIDMVLWAFGRARNQH